MNGTFYDGHDELYHCAKFGEDRTMRAGCRCENMVFVFVCLFVGHAPSPEHRAFEGCIVRTSIALPFIARFRRGFQRFFHMWLLFQMHDIVLIFVARWRHNLREIAVKLKILKSGLTLTTLRLIVPNPLRSYSLMLNEILDNTLHLLRCLT